MYIADSSLRYDTRADHLGRAIEWLLAGLIVFTPLAFGAVQAWSEELVVLLAAALSVCFLLRVRATEHASVAWTWAYVPVAAFILVAIVQLIPMPASLIRLVSPHAAALKTELLGDLPGAERVLSNMTVSFYPYATRHDLRLVLALGVVFVVVLNVYRRPDQIMRLLGVIAAAGAGVVLLALAQDIAGNGRIYWFVPTPQGTARSGPFVNHSHYAQYVSLSMGAALGLAFVKLHEGFTHRHRAPATVAEYLSSSDARIVWAVAAMAILGAATVFLSMSRGGMVSLLMAGAFTTLILSLRHPLKGPAWMMVLFALGAFACVLYIGFDAVYDRLATLGNLRESSGGRWQILEDIAVAWTRFPLLGTGLGTHEVVYPMFDRSVVPELAAYAENEYAQVTEETGIAGLIALTIFGIIVWFHYVWATRMGHVPVCSAAYGLGFGLIAILVHSLSDFGQHVPANAILSAISCALLIRFTRGTDETHEARTATVTTRRAAGVWMAVFAGVCLVWGWALLDANSARIAEGHWKRALAAERNLITRQWQGSNEEYAYLIGHAVKAADSEPDNVKYQHWLNVYRWQSISRTTDPNTGNLVMSPQALAFAQRITEEVSDARALCPTFGATWCVLGQLERTILGHNEQGARHIRMGRRLAPCDATTCLVSGMLNAEDGDLEAAFEDWRRAVQLDGDLYREVASMCLRLPQRPERVLELVGENTGRLLWLAGALEGAQVSSGLVQEVNRKVSELLRRKCQEAQAPADACASLAAICRREGNIDEAIRLYRRALASNFGRYEWHYRLASLLAGKGLAEEAIQEANICLRFGPSYEPARKLLADLSVRTEPLEERPGSR